MTLPADMNALEARLYTLVGERMVEEPVAALEAFADRRTWSTLRSLAKHVDQPVAHLFALPWLEAFHERVTAAEWRAFASVLLDWAGEEAVVAAPLAVGSSEALPPREWGELATWARERGLEARLDDPSNAILPFTDALYGAMPLAPWPTLRTLFQPSKGARGGPREKRASSAFRDAARAYLAYCAGRKDELDRRRTLAKEPAETAAVAAARARLAALVSALAPLEPAPPLVSAEVHVHLDAESMRFHLEHPYRSGWGSHEVWVSLIEQDEGGRALASVSEPNPSSVFGIALRVAAERALDALLDPEDLLHEELVTELTRPAWSRMLEALKATLAMPEDEASSLVPEERLVWRVRAEERVTVTAALQKRGKRGWSRGRHLELREVADRGDIDARDRRVASAAFGRRRSYATEIDRGALLRALVGHPRVVLEANAARSVRVRRAALEILLRDEADGQTSIGFNVGELELSPRELVAGYVAVGSFARLSGRELIVAPVSATLLELAEICARFGATFPRKADEALLEMLARLPAEVGVEVPPRMRGEAIAADPRARVRLEPLPGGGLRAELHVRPLEGGPTHLPGEGPRHIFHSGPDGRRYAERDLGLERRTADETITALHLDHAEPDGRFAWLLDEPEAALTMLEAAQQLGDALRLEWPEGTRAWAIVEGAKTFKVGAKSAQDWFALRGELTVDEESVNLATLMSALRGGRRFVEMTPGRFARISDELAGKLSVIEDVAFDQGADIVLAPELAGRLRELLPETDFAPDPDFDGMCGRLREAAARPVELPALDAVLRGYQQEGTEWLLRTAAWARGACLADDMGLGKTLQALTLLSARASLGPAIVVCPTSVADNWCAEAARFASGKVEVRLLRGPDRAGVLDGLGAGHVLVTSYDIMVRDADALIEIPFATAVFDEAQLLKNPDTQRRKVARRLSADFSLALSGTPLENHLGELWSIFDVLVPGLLGPWKRFRDRFAAPIERRGDKARLETLRGLLTPFLLRRTKGEVAPELPARTEVVRAIELSSREQALYEAERRRVIEHLAGGESAGASRDQRFAVLAALTRLRRLACHPALIDPASSVRSSKLDELLRMADDLVREGHRALVFSQFTSHLALVRSALEDAGHEALYLDGSTPGAERANLVRRFQEGAMPFFLISLKAGGTGLNLTAADTVIHLDPWWNPAVEDQASDRTHRIGQTKPVTVIRMVSHGTIEEAVLELHGEKRELARGLLEGAENNARLDTSELLSLLGS